MKNLLLTLLAAIVTMASFNAQSFGEIQGKIVDENGDPMPLVYVAVKTATTVLETETDFNGKFKIKPLPVGTYTLKASNVGYHDLTLKELKVTTDKTLRLFNLSMKSSITIIDGAEIIEYKTALIDPEETSIKTIDMDDFKHSPTKSIVGVITAVVSDVSTGNNGELYFRGSRNGASVMYLDGVKLMGSSLPSVPNSGISNVMVYTGGIPAKYGDTTGGVVVIETKNSFAEYYKRLARL